MTETSQDWPRIRNLGTDGLLVSFSDRLQEPANRAALALRSAVEAAGWDDVEEVTTSLASTALRLSPFADFQALEDKLAALVRSRDWMAEPLPVGRKLFRIPTVYGTNLAPQLEESAQVAGVPVEDAIAQLSSAQVRVITIGFAPGQPYLGELAPHWDIPRQSNITPQVPAGALVLAIRQFVLFSVANPTGWRHVGQTAAQLFTPDAADPFMLTPGDEVIFNSVSEAEFATAQSDPLGGATWEVIA